MAKNGPRSGDRNDVTDGSKSGVKVSGSAVEVVSRTARRSVRNVLTGRSLHLQIPSAAHAPSDGGSCFHDPDCSCRRPYLGRALVIAVAMELFMGLVAISTGATLIGVVACASMAGCMWLYALAEVVAFYRVGLPQPDPIELSAERHRVG